MTGPPQEEPVDDVQPWPAWLRGTLLAVLVAAIGIGVVVALYDKGFLPLTGPFVAALLAPLILRGRHYWLARRRQRERNESASRPDAAYGPLTQIGREANPLRVQALERALREELSRPLAERSTGAEDVALDGAVRRVSTAHRLLVDGSHDAAADLLAQVAHHVSDSWSHTSPLSTEVLACSRALHRS